MAPKLMSQTGTFLFLAMCVTSGNAFKSIPPRLPILRSKASQRMTASASESLPLVEPFGKGLTRDVKLKTPFYKSDFTDAFNIKSLSSVIFLFFACLAPAVAFGGLLGLATKGQMGTMETVGATAIGGVLYSLFSAQPLTIIGTTGPLLAFLKVLYETCSINNVPFLPVYSWVGLWCSLFLFISSLFSMSNVVEYFTRFTDDIFSSLISVIFIVEAVKDLNGKFANPAVSGLQAFVTLAVALITFLTAKVLSGLRRSPFLNRKVREVVSDFAPTIGVFTGVFAAAVASKRYSSISLPMLSIPTVLSTTSGRPWMVDIFSVSNKIRLLCVFPAIMATVLLFMDQNITTRLIMSKENKLKKGSGLHLDMFVVAGVTAITSLLGMPWMVAATVRSLAHLRSLKLYKITEAPTAAEKESPSPSPESESTVAAKVEMTGVQEQRVTGLLIHSLIGFSIINLRSVLRSIPNAVLTGLFLYLGVSSITTTDLFDRFKLFFTDNRDIPSGFSWSKSIDVNRTKLFTAIQLFLLSAMWWMKGTKLGVFFPVLIGALAPARIALEKFKIFSKEELNLLDGEIA